MLPPFIIEQIRKREERQSQYEKVLELPLYDRSREPMPQVRPQQDPDEPQRGVIIVDL